MSGVDLHPEELLDGHRAGTLGEAARARLRAHCEVCPACAAEVAWSRDGMHRAEPGDQDTARAARAVAALVGQTLGDATPSPQHPPGHGTGQQDTRVSGARPGRRGRRRFAGALAAGLLLFGGSAAAYWTESPVLATLKQLVRTLLPPEVPPAPSHSGVGHYRPRASAAASTSPPRPERVPASEPLAPGTHAPPSFPAAERNAPAGTSPAETAAPKPPAPRPVTRPVTRTRDARHPAAMADGLLRRASGLRRAGQTTEAADVYAQVARRFGGTRAGRAARVALGSLRLHALDDPRGARAAFAAYLQQCPGEPLCEEALVGLARSAQRLGDRVAEAKAWRRLLAAFPTSVHGASARARLAGLDKALAGPEALDAPELP